jgi:toxin-antitoxin system PIN domain toxin
MTSSSFPDVNVWLALASPEHTGRESALNWWDAQEEPILFSRITQMGLLRLLTMAAPMNGKPLQMKQAWKVYDEFLSDERVVFAPEPATIENRFRVNSKGAQASPKLWTDAYLLAFAAEAGAGIVTFDQALAARAGVAPLR